ncbi:MAG: putative toxin-antitoxin system toxin component, PIN family [Gammaproteobacteria bacterium]|jgi:putative PIN family toxin of toxin-antitoxin system|nr:putative toxin-antitoxin system toxin component, PIN family [Gammaproteobacteria bacterium]
MTVDRLVVDSNVLISAVLTSGGAPAKLLDHLQQTRAVLVFSEPTMEELATRLLRSRFDRYVDRATRLRFLAEIDAVAEFVGISNTVIGCRDRNDDKFLETALTADCQLIVSGDQDLLLLHPWRNIHILRPAQVMQMRTDQEQTLPPG